MGAFFTALFTVLGQNIGIGISIILGGAGAYCLISPRGRYIVKSGFNWMFSTAANNPKLAAGAFDEKIKELRGMLRKAEDVNQKALGQLAEAHDQYERAKLEYDKYSKKAIALEKRGDHDQAILLAKNASRHLSAMKTLEEKIPSYTGISEATTKRVNEIQWLIADVEQRKETAISNMEKGKFEKEVSEALKGLNVSEIDAYIKQIEDNANDKKYQAIGARMSYETSEVKLLKDAEESATAIDAEEFLQELINEDNEDN